MGKRRANGEGTLRKRPDGRWESTFMIGWQDDGRRKYISFYGKTLAELRRKVDLWKRQREMGFLVERDYYFSEWADRWFDIHKENVSETTRENYKYILRTLKKYFGKRRLKEIKAYDIDVFLLAMKRDGVAESSIGKYRGMMYQIMNKAKANDLILKNPVEFAEKQRRKIQPKRREVFSAEEVKRLLTELPYNRTGNSIRLLLGTGMRTQELLALEPRHIAENGSVVHVEQAVERVKGSIRIGPPKTAESTRVIPVPSSLQFIAKALRNTDKQFIWEEKIPGQPCNSSFFGKQFRKALEDIPDMRVLTPHCCRHTFVSQMQALGVDVSTIRSIVGHAEMDMTEYYLHVQESVRREAATRFGIAFTCGSGAESLAEGEG